MAHKIVDRWGKQLSSSAKKVYHKYLKMFQKVVINSDFTGTPKDSLLTLKLFAHCTQAVREALSIYIETIECKCVWINKPKKDNSWCGKTYSKSNYSGTVTIYPISRNKMMEMGVEAFYDLFIISENALYFTLKSMGIPYIVCKGWIVNINSKSNSNNTNDYKVKAYEIDKIRSNTINHYLNDKQYEYKIRHVKKNKGYSHYVGTKTKKSKCTPKPLRMTLRSRSKKETIDTDNNTETSKKRKLSSESENVHPPKKKRRVSRRKRK
eukprot:513517_1